MLQSSKVVLLLLGLVAISNAGNFIRVRGSSPVVAAAPVKTYGQQFPVLTSPKVVEVAAAAPVEEAEEEETEVEPEPFKAAVRTPVDRTPIRVTYSKQPERESSSRDRDSHSARLENERVIEDQNKNAQYNFGAAIDDGINDMSQVRQESRDGLKTEGSYSYSDGYFKYTVKYVADENGYRVLESTKEQIGDGTGPIVDPVNGKADIHTSNQGVEMAYSVSAKELEDFGKDRIISEKSRKTTKKIDDSF